MCYSNKESTSVATKFITRYIQIDMVTIKLVQYQPPVNFFFIFF